MTDPRPDAPIMPTGSGIADLEIARELNALESGEPVATDVVPTIDALGLPESEAHPS